MFSLSPPTIGLSIKLCNLANMLANFGKANTVLIYANTGH